MIKKNITNIFSFAPTNKTDGSVITTGTVTIYITKDNGTQATSTNSPVHKGNGQWIVELTAEELNADQVSLLITHADAMPEAYNIYTTAKTIAELNDIDLNNITDNSDFRKLFSAAFGKVVYDSDTKEFSIKDVDDDSTTLLTFKFTSTDREVL